MLACASKSLEALSSSARSESLLGSIADASVCVCVCACVVYVYACLCVCVCVCVCVVGGVK